MDFNGLNRCFFLPQISTNQIFVESRGICVSLRSETAESLCEI